MTKMQADSFVKIGKKHYLCQDSALSFINPFPCAIISDGCSGSPNSEIGSKILSNLTKQYLLEKEKEGYLHDISILNFMNNIAIKSDIIRKMLGLNQSCLDATLLFMYLIDNTVIVIMIGDGCVINVNKNDEIICNTINYNASMPYYLSYKLNKERTKIFNGLKETQKKIKQTHVINPNQTLHNITEELETNYEFQYFCFDASSLKQIMIASDGLQSFFINSNNEDDQNNLMNSVITQCSSFKNTNGEFIKRRMGSKNGVINTFAKQGIYHYDDISIAGFSFE